MDEYLARVDRIYPNGHYVLIPKYDPEQWKDREYNSAFDSKGALNRWNTKPLSYEDAQAKASEGYRIGWVVPKGLVVVDIDNHDDPRSQEYVEKILEKFEAKFSYNYTSRGMHILFQDSTNTIKTLSEYRCSLNIQIDTRANGTGYIILPVNDPHRKWGVWNDFVEDIPYFLKPCFKDRSNTPTFIGMQNGDGRNDALFRWRGKLEHCHMFTAKEVEKSIRIINENLLAEPITNNELFKTVLRQIEEKKESSIDKDNVYNLLADELISKFDIVSYFENFYMFNGTYYKAINDIEVEKLIHFELSKNLSRAARKEIMEFLKIKTQVKAEDFDKDWHKIACKNGVINLVTGELEQPNKSEINTICIPYNYEDDPVYSPRIDQFMKEITNGDMIKMEFLYQIAGYCLLKKNLFEKFFIMKGEGGTGKSTFTNLLQKMVGGDINCSHIGLPDFDREYFLAQALSKLLNVDDDVVDGKMLENTGKFKSIVSGNMISVRQIYKPVIEFAPYITLIFNCNKLPRLMDKTSGLYRRMVLVELNHKVEHPDPLFMNKVTVQDMEYMLYKAVQAIKVAIEEGHFRISCSEEQLLQLFQRRQSPLNEWIYETQLMLGEVDKARCLSLYSQFTAWCSQNGYTKIPTTFTFKEDICALYDVEIDCNSREAMFVKRGVFDPNFKPF